MKISKGERERIRKIIGILKEMYPNAHIALRFKNPFQLLVSVILSAQCTDERVNQVTAVLFSKYPDAQSMAEAPIEELEQLVRPTGFFRNKARNIKEAARMIVERYGGRVPDTMEELLSLPGVARKTANIVLYQAYGKVEGIAVDTHVKRLARRLGMTREENPVKIERDLMEVVPRQDWGPITYMLIEHGRRVCKARKPACDICRLRELCPSAKGSSR